MHSPTEKSPLLLSKGRSMTLDHATSTVIRCQVGSLWVTQDNDVRDVVLEAGDEFRPDREGVVLVHALKPSRVFLVTHEAHRISRWKQSMDSLVRRLAASVASRRPAIE